MKRVETAISRLMPDIDGKRVLEPACGCAEFLLRQQPTPRRSSVLIWMTSG